MAVARAARQRQLRLPPTRCSSRELTFERAASACRGGALFNVEAHVFLSNELPPLMARRETTFRPVADARFPGQPPVADCPVFMPNSAW